MTAKRQQPAHNPHGLHKDWRKIAKQLRKNGSTVAPTRGGHYGVYAPDGRLVVTMAATASDHRSMKNAMAQLKREGLI